MNTDSSATNHQARALSPRVSGVGLGFLGVLTFSFTVPWTRVAVAGLPPLFISSGRAVVAGVLAALALLITHQRLPKGRQWLRILVVAAGVVVGFPFLTSFALVSTPASHGAVVIALLPAATAVCAVLRTEERPPARFWVFAILGSAAAMAFAAFAGGGLQGLHRADLLLLGAVVAAGIAYAEGGLLSRELGSWQTISWALVLALPLMIVLTAVSMHGQAVHASPTQWAAFAYLGLVSMFLGFFAWYRGLAIGPMSTVSQIQLIQPVLSIGWAALFLGEEITWATVVGGLAVIACAAASVRVRQRH